VRQTDDVVVAGLKKSAPVLHSQTPLFTLLTTGKREQGPGCARER
jgi:hypothetical protein